jgi:hypothetical protein
MRYYLADSDPYKPQLRHTVTAAAELAQAKLIQ